MVLAHLAGIKIFATGGLGGVHRGGQVSMDISADLTELGRTPVTVISSGCKSFLDISRTLEYLETQGVGVGTFADGRDGSVEFPAFWTRDSGIRSPTIISDEREAAAITYAQSTLGLSSGLLFANPIPARFSVTKSQMDAIMAQAVLDAETSCSAGSDVTPFILARIRELTGGQSVIANRALVEANVVRGTKVACELAKLQTSPAASHKGKSSASINNTLFTARKPFRDETASTESFLPNSLKVEEQQADVFVAGSLAIDLACDFIPTRRGESKSPELQTSNPAKITQGLGGVGQNVASAIQYLGTTVQLCSVVGDDAAGKTAKSMLMAKGLSSSAVVEKSSCRTAQYVAVNDARKDLVLAMADMAALEGKHSEMHTVWKPHLNRHMPKWLVVDANWDFCTLKEWFKYGREAKVRIAFEPVSVAKARRLFTPAVSDDFELGILPDHGLSLATPNSAELESMHTAAHEAGFFDRDDWWQIIDALGLPSFGSTDKFMSMTDRQIVALGIPQQSVKLLPFIPTVLTKLGEGGVLMTQVMKPGDDRLTSRKHSQYLLSRADIDHPTIGGVYMRLFRPAEIVPEEDVVSVNGAGDTFLGIVIAGLTKENPKSLIELIDIAQQGSVMTLKSKEAVSPEIGKLKGLL
ncbi:MAG: hypothetical protein Q9184_004657 [Pyrenodesmia sp. 2 TL-2023]